jgi:hypothetical protein
MRTLGGRSRLPRSLGLPLALATALVGASGAAALLGATVGPSLEGLRDVLATVDPTSLLAFGCAALAAAAAGVAAWVVTGRHRVAALRRLWIPVAGALAVELAAFLLLYPALDPGRSPRPIAEAAAAATAPDEPIGLVSDRAMLGGLAYYGGRRVVPLGSERSIRRFVELGGRTFIVKARKVERVTAVTPVQEVARLRAGRRAVLVVQGARPAGDAPLSRVDPLR